MQFAPVVQRALWAQNVYCLNHNICLNPFTAKGSKLMKILQVTQDIENEGWTPPKFCLCIIWIRLFCIEMYSRTEFRNNRTEFRNNSTEVRNNTTEFRNNTTEFKTAEQKILGGISEKRFFEWAKMAKDKIFRHFYSNFFHVYIINK